MLEQIIKYDLGNLASAQLNHHAHAILVRFITQSRDAINLLVLDQLGDLFQQARLVYLIRQLRDDNGLFAIFFIFLDLGACPHMYTPPASQISLANTSSTIDYSSSRKIWSWNDFQ